MEANSYDARWGDQTSGGLWGRAGRHHAPPPPPCCSSSCSMNLRMLELATSAFVWCLQLTPPFTRARARARAHGTRYLHTLSPPYWYTTTGQARDASCVTTGSSINTRGATVGI
eukprot:7037481-Prymnesium_polylepis.2